MPSYTYIVECEDGSLYAGYSNDVPKRLDMHNCGKGAKYTRSRRPVKLVYMQEHATAEAAMRREAQIKKLTRDEKLRLCATWRDGRA